MKISGWQKVSLQDFPNMVSTILFTKGCNFKCGYCHNPELIETTGPQLDLDEIFEYLEKRKAMLDAVVITGGEPCIQKDLKGFIRMIKAHGFAVKLDTNGTMPHVVKDLIESKLVDYLAMDYKFPINRYSEMVKTENISDKVEETKNLIINSELPYEFRITVIQELFDEETVKQMALELKDAKKIVLQGFLNKEVLDPRFQKYENTRTLFLEHIKPVFKEKNIHKDDCEVLVR